MQQHHALPLLVWIVSIPPLGVSKATLGITCETYLEHHGAILSELLLYGFDSMLQDGTCDAMFFWQLEFQLWILKNFLKAILCPVQLPYSLIDGQV